jgi:hypothetical protein
MGQSLGCPFKGVLMSEQNINARCSICGEGYHLCKTCSDVKSFLPWRTVTDTVGHYLIYTAIHGYTISKDKIKARSELEKCDLSELKKFNPEIQMVINEIMESENSDKETANTNASAAKEITKIRRKSIATK